MTSRPERCRARAVECRIAAEKTKDQEAKDTFLTLARNWYDLADKVEYAENQCAALGDLAGIIPGRRD
jgi:hypothetical protein